ncbi:MAG: class I SAM-dependent methyltransferase [Christensenellales bacterium]
MIKLDARLRAIVDNVDGRVLADVGCDHGKIGLTALKENRVNKTIESDVSAPSLDKAISLAAQEGLDNVEFICCDGFDGYQDYQADVAVISGMGGREIVKILSRRIKGVERYVLSAHKDVAFLRQYLYSQGYSLTKDYVVKSGKKFYNVIVAVSGIYTPDYREIMLGKNQPGDKVFEEYVETEIAKIERYKSHIDDETRKYYELLRQVQKEIRDETGSNNQNS